MPNVRKCQGCTEEFNYIRGNRGRPPLYCLSCRKKPYYKRLRKPTTTIATPILINGDVKNSRIREAANSVREEQEQRRITPTGVILSLAKIDMELKNIETVISSSHSRWTPEWQQSVAESLQTISKRAELLSTIANSGYEVTDENLRELLSWGNDGA